MWLLGHSGAHERNSEPLQDLRVWCYGPACSKMFAAAHCLRAVIKQFCAARLVREALGIEHYVGSPFVTLDTDNVGFQPFHFSIDNLPPQDRVPIWREVFGRKVMRLDMEPLRDVSDLSFSSRIHAHDGLSLVTVAFSGAHVARTRELMSDGNDAISICVNMSAPCSAASNGQDVTLGQGDAIITFASEYTAFSHTELGHQIAFSFPRAVCKEFVPNIEDMLGRVIPCGSPGLDLLLSYAKAFMDSSTAGTMPKLRQQAVTHIYDLAALTVGTTRDIAVVAQARGGAATRLGVIKADIINHLADPRLTIDGLAARHGITPRYIQLLFQREGTSFTDFVLSQRLTLAHRLLFDPRRARHTVSSIAYDAGFSDLSYFNRVFRRRFGATPSELRHAAQQKTDD